MESPFTRPEFITELRRKLLDLYLSAYLYQDVDGKKFNKDLVSDPLFCAIHFYQQWAIDLPGIEEMLEGAEGELPRKLRLKLETIRCAQNEISKQSEKILAVEILRAIRARDSAGLEHLVKLATLNIKRFVSGRSASYKRPDWKYFTCAVTLQSLVCGIVPTKKKVREDVFHEMAVHALPAEATQQEIAAEIKRLQSCSPRQWAKIFKSLGLSALPSAPTTRVIKPWKPPERP